MKYLNGQNTIPMLGNIHIYKYLTVSPSTNNNLEVLRTFMRQNIPTRNNGDLHVWPGSQCLLIPKLNSVGQLNGSQTIYTGDLMIGMCTGLHHHQHGTTVHVQ